MNFLKAFINFFPRLFKALFGSKKDKISNKYLFKRGGYAVAVIALVLAGAVVLNLLVGFLADRFDLEYDLTSDRKIPSATKTEIISKMLTRMLLFI